MDIREIDVNFRIEKGIDGIKFCDAREACDLYGVYYDEKHGAYVRLDPDFARTVSDGVGNLAFHTTGGRIRFSTDSKKIAIRCSYPYRTEFSHMPFSGTCGFTLYADYKDKRSLHLNTFMPWFADEKGYTASYDVPDNVNADGYTLYFPLYNPISELLVGIQTEAKIGKGLDYNGKKVLFYGSSITQGGCASTSASDYVSLLGRKLNFDYINLGFSGNAKGESNMAEYLASLHPDVFVCDYDHNTPSVEHLEKTHYALYETFRKQNPDTPIIFVSKPRARMQDVAYDEARFNVIRSTYQRAKLDGDDRVFLVNGKDFFATASPFTVDGTHPTDYGFARMAKVIEPSLIKALAWLDK